MAPRESRFRGMLGSVELELVRQSPAQAEVTPGTSRDERADYALRKTGKVPVLKRRFGLMSILGFACISLNEWTSAYFTFQIGYANGGPAGLIYEYIIAWLGTLAAFVSLAELVSMAPVASGQYHWISMLAPRSSMKILSYITGWLTMLGWQSSCAVTAFAFAEIMTSFAQGVSPGYEPKLWHTTLIYYATLAVGTLMTTVLGEGLSKLEVVFLVLYIVGYFVCLVPLVWLAPHGSAHDVFGTFINNGGWSTQGLSFMVGLSAAAFDLLGADGIYHMGEEIHNAHIVVPKAIILSLTVGGVLGLATYIGLLFSIGDPEAILESNYAYPFVQVFQQATQNIAGTAIMTMCVIILQLGGVIAYVAAASRMLWAFARDHGMPGWHYLQKVNPRTTIPVNAIFFTATFSILVGLISIGSSVAFNDLLSLAISALYASYFVACFGLLYRRVRGQIRDRTGDDLTGINLPGAEGRLEWGQFHIPGLLGTLVNGFGCAYLAVVFFFAFWPTSIPVSAESMNYTVLVFGVVAIFSAVYYIVWAKHTYKGPIVEIAAQCGK